MNNNTFFAFLFLVVAFLVIGCSGQPLIPGRHPAEETVETMYATLSAGDNEAYIDTILPENRRRPNPLGLLEGLSLVAGPAMLDIGPLVDFTFTDVQATLVREEDGYALVQAEGYVRFPALTWELPFCDQHDVRQQGGAWYVDVYAPERLARLERIGQFRLELLDNPDLWSDLGSGDGLAGLLNGLDLAMEMALNLCE